jgi:hypothetical protein
VAKQPDPAAQCNGFQNVDWDMQLNVYKIKRCAILLQPQLSPDVDRNIVWQRRQLFFQETEVSIRCRELFKYKRPDDLISNNTTPNINKKKTENVFLWIRGDYWATRCVNLRPSDASIGLHSAVSSMLFCIVSTFSSLTSVGWLIGLMVRLVIIFLFNIKCINLPTLNYLPSYSQKKSTNCNVMYIICTIITKMHKYTF